MDGKNWWPRNKAAQFSSHSSTVADRCQCISCKKKKGGGWSNRLQWSVAVVTLSRLRCSNCLMILFQESLSLCCKRIAATTAAKSSDRNGLVSLALAAVSSCIDECSSRFRIPANYIFITHSSLVSPGHWWSISFCEHDEVAHHSLPFLDFHFSDQSNISWSSVDIHPSFHDTAYPAATPLSCKKSFMLMLFPLYPVTDCTLCICGNCTIAQIFL